MMVLRHAVLAVLIAGGAVSVFLPDRLHAQPLVADLSSHLVAITTGFVGTEVLLFGAVDGPGEVVVVVRGPRQPMRVHRKSRVMGVWMTTATMTFESVPSFYSVSASGPLEEIAPPTVRQRHEMGLDSLDVQLPRAKASPDVAAEWRDGLIRNMQREGLYGREVGPVTFLGERLFRSTLFFPANVPTGSYMVEVYLLREGRVVSAQTTPLIVSRVGVEAEIHYFAYERSAAYGGIAIAIALMAGWLAHTLFRKA